MGRWRVLPKHKADSGIWLKFPGFKGRLKCGECVKKGPMAYGKELNVPEEGFHLIVTE